MKVTVSQILGQLKDPTTMASIGIVASVKVTGLKLDKRRSHTESVAFQHKLEGSVFIHPTKKVLHTLGLFSYSTQVKFYFVLFF